MTNDAIDEFKLRKNMSVDEKKYDQYINNYVKRRDTDEKKTWQILIDNITSIDTKWETEFRQCLD